MILAVSVPEKRELVIAAADSLDSQRSFIGKVQDENPQLIQDTDFTRYLVDPDLAKFKMSPTILEFPSEDEMRAFIAAHQIELTNFANAHGRQASMLSQEEFRDDSGRTLGEIHNLVENDPWDRRTEEEKAEAEEQRKKMQDKRKSGDLTGDSFGAGGAKKKKNDEPEEKESGGIRIRDINVKVNDDGTVEIGRVLADKDLFAPDMYHITILEDNSPTEKKEPYEVALKRAGLIGAGRYGDVDYEGHDDGGIIVQLGGSATERMKDALDKSGHPYRMNKMLEEKLGDEYDTDYKIADDQMVAVYFRIDVATGLTTDVIPVLEAASVREPYRARDMGVGCWLAYVRSATADDALTALVAAGYQAEKVEVDHMGERIIEEGSDATVVDTGAAFVEPPMPWNDRAEEFAAMTEDEQRKALKGRFLLYTVRDHGYPHGRIIHITPRSYFNEHDKLWEGELPIQHLLPPNFDKFGDKVGVYHCKSLDLNTADFLLGNKAEMKESLMLRMHVNGLGDDAW
jgi:hypothetical protein